MPTTPPEQEARPWAALIDQVLATPPGLLYSTPIPGEIALGRALADMRLSPFPFTNQGMARRLLGRMALYLAEPDPPF